MSKKNMNKRKTSIFFLPPSFFALIAGSGIGLTTNLLMDFIKNHIITYDIALVVILLFTIFPISFICISLRLENISRNTESRKNDEKEEESDRWILIDENKSYLWFFFILGILSFVLGMFYIIRLYSFI